MKRLLSLLACCLLFFSCEKETMLTVDQTSLSFTDAGGSSSITLTANKPWSASSNQSWCKVSLSGGEEATGSRIAISCDANTTYDARNATITITCAELTKQISISQATNNGLLVSQTSYELTKAAQQLSIQVQANVKFSVEVDNSCKDWIKYNSTKSLSTSTVVLDIAENKSYDAREGKVTIKQDGGSLSSTITIKQSQLDGLFITTPEYNLSNEKHTLTVEVKSNIDFEVKPEADWIKYIETKGLKTNQIILNIEANETYDAREGKVTVKQKNGGLSETIVVRQEQNYGLIITQTEYDLSNVAQTIDVEVKFNVDFDVVIPSGCRDWIKQVSTKGLNNRTYTFSIAKNESYDNREGSITFKQKNGALSGTITVKQGQDNGLFVTKSDYELTNEAQTITAEVKANIDFEVKSEVDWVKVIKTKGLKTSQISLSVEENEGFDLREGKVSVKQVDGDLKGTINIKQNGKNGIILPQSEYELTNVAQTLNVEVQTTVQFEVVISDNGKDWVSLVSTKALDTKTCTFSIKKNETYDNRQCEVSFKQKGGEKSNSFIIKQAKTNYLEIAKKEYSVDIEGEIITIDVTSNVDYHVSVLGDGQSWLKIVETKGLNNEKILVSVAAGEEKTDRFGEIEVCYEEIKHTVLIHQFAGSRIIVFADEQVKEKLVAAFDTNLDGELTIAEAQSVKNIDGVFGTDVSYTSFDEFRYFMGVSSVPDEMFSGWSLLTSITFPSSIRTIGKQAFNGCTGLGSIIIPDGVTSISDGSFRGCSKLSFVKIPESVISIGNSAFNYCYNLTSISIPNQVTSIGDSAFFFCGKLSSIKIPESVIHIRPYAFSDCYNLSSSITIPDGVTSIEEGTFKYCHKLSSIIIPESVTSIGKEAFCKCYALTTIVIPKNVTSIGEGAFDGCNNISSIIIPERVTVLEKNAFHECRNLSSITIPDRLISIGGWAFGGCVRLKSINIPEGVTSIEEYAFRECISLTTVSIPKTVTKIGLGAFYGCDSLNDVTVLAVTPPIMSYSYKYNCFDSTGGCPIYVPAESVDAYLFANGWKNYSSRIQAIPE